MKNRTVLIVDDEPALLRILSTYFAQHVGYSVLKASTCCDAIDIILKAPPDCVILDYNLPDGNARHVCAAIECDGKTTPPVIVFSASEDARACLKGEYPADMVLSKNTPMQEIPGLIDKLIAEREKSRR